MSQRAPPRRGRRLRSRIESGKRNPCAAFAAYVSWRDSIVGLSGQGPVEIDLNRQASIKQALSGVVLAARNYLGVGVGEAPSIRSLTEVLFDG